MSTNPDHKVDLDDVYAELTQIKVAQAEDRADLRALTSSVQSLTTTVSTMADTVSRIGKVSLGQVASTIGVVIAGFTFAALLMSAILSPIAGTLTELKQAERAETERTIERVERITRLETKVEMLRAEAG